MATHLGRRQTATGPLALADPHRTAVAAEIPKRNAATRTVMPPANASATRWRKSRERGCAIIAGLLTSNDLDDVDAPAPAAAMMPACHPKQQEEHSR
ncbi:hypothetical protein [Sinorhizobium medicae]|uniref:hypothetical protein n=1 Tax=Sinorhizobium medicae TaxID=110321 RepID=UPI001390235A|nr:hypothetical protein [Sinorhizobium medicae]